MPVKFNSVLYRAIQTAMLLIGAAATGALIYEYGFGLSDRWMGQFHRYEFSAAYTFCFLQMAKLLVVMHPIRYIRKNWLQFALVLIMLFQLAATLGLSTSPEYQYLLRHYRQVPLATISLAFVQIYFVAAMFVGSAAFHKILVKLRLNPVFMVGLSFASLITLGAVFLKFPKAVQPGQYISWTDAFFTATSAVCVTGLGTVDTGGVFSIFGQTVTMLLFQIGGLGVITFTAFMAFFSGSGIYGDDARKIMVILDENQRSAGRVLFKIIAVTLTIEAIGAVLLYHGWKGEIADPLMRGYFALYHSVSAFCNAGFGLYADSLARFRADSFMILVFCGLIILGSLGMPVLFSMPGSLVKALRGRSEEIPAHFKAVVGINIFMIVTGTILFFSLAGPGFMDGFALKEKFLSALFLSITTRTCGFISMDLAGISALVTGLCVLYMFIGGSPASTAGGIKTAGAGVLVAAAYKRLFKKPYEAVRLAGTIVISKTVRKAVTIASVMLCMGVVSVALLYFTEDFPLKKVIFEVFSAIGTVGLSMGITPALGSLSKWVIIGCMYIGRVVPGVIVILINNRDSEKEDIILG